jgi:hypothetical protein
MIRRDCVDGAYNPVDSVLGPAWYDFEIDCGLGDNPSQPNPYFHKATAGQNLYNIHLTRAYWLHVLEKYGYIERIP